MTANHDIPVLTVSAATENLADVRNFVRSQLVGLGFTEIEEQGIVLAVDEACSNLIRHAYLNDASRTFSVAVKVTDSDVRVEIHDSSPAFDPCCAGLPDMAAYFRDRRAGGLGILIMTRVMDDIDYHPAGNGRPYNTLVLTKHRSSR